MPSISDLNVDDREIISDILALKPEPDDHLASTIIVDGCPTVGPEKFNLLKKILLDKFSKFGTIVDHIFPLDEQNQTMGYILITYEKSKNASQAVRNMNNVSLDKSHTFQVTLLCDYESIINVSTEWKAPPVQEYKDVGNLKSWLLDEYCRDQYVVVHSDGQLGSVYLHSANESTLVEERKCWTEGWAKWSPKGTYLATMHTLGVILWGSDKFVKIGRFQHRKVKMVDFSPQEKFMVSISQSTTATADDQDVMAELIIWDVRRCISKRVFTMPVESYPAFKWSYNDDYFASLREGSICVYDTNTFQLLDRKKIGNNIRDFSWSPTDNILAYWLPESSNTPARVVLISVPSKEELCTKNLFSVAEINLNWHEQGDFLAVQVLRCAKKKIDVDKQVKYVGTYLNFEIVRMREKLYPVDQIEVKNSICCFQWEPKHTRFAFLQNLPSGKLVVSIYDVPRGANIHEIASIELTSARTNELRWSPDGNFLVVAGLKSADGMLEFISANDAQVLAKCQHPMLNEIHWDPTGRYIATIVNSFHQKNDNAIWFWNCIGRSLYKVPYKGLKLFTWRPRPKTLLSTEQLQSLKKNMSKYNTHFANEDRMLATKANREFMERNMKLLNEFNEWKTNLIKRYNSEKQDRIALRDGFDMDTEYSEAQVEEEIEFLISSVKEVVRKNTEE